MSEETKRCGEPSLYRYTWPGQNEKFCCPIHALQLANVAAMMGFYLQLIPLTDHHQMTDNPCSQSVKDAQA